MRKLVLIFIVLSFVNIKADRFPNTASIISPGIKIGYAFGEQAGFIFGVEISYIPKIGNGKWNYGTVISYDIGNNYQKVHLGLEGFVYLGGVDIGPTILIADSKVYYGYSITPFLGLLIYPYFNYSRIWNYRERTISEIGGYGKLPLFFNKVY